MKLAKYSIGMGDRFGHQAKAQLAVVQKALEKGVEISPVWNKSHREHTIIGSTPEMTKLAVEKAIRSSNWNKPYFLDADHISLKNVALFIDSCNFFTLDVAEAIGGEIEDYQVAEYLHHCRKYIGKLTVPGIDEPLMVTENLLINIAKKYLPAIHEAAKIFAFIKGKRKDDVVIEVSMDETDSPQTPVELLFILEMMASKGIEADTIAPKFSGEFFKGVDYVGDVGRFATEFSHDLAIIRYAIGEFGLPENLKLSVHSGSDKFAIYPKMNAALKKFNMGIHLKTAGTNWLEELVGLAESGDEGLAIAREIYRQGFAHREALCQPYATVINIDFERLPKPERVDTWSGRDFAEALRHNPSNPNYDPNLRQLLHVSYKIAAQMGDKYLNALKTHETIIAKNVTANLYEKHVVPLFLS
ncbi:MAG: hypothetical protein JXQ65_04640 [Candidatus Marinimicrobia bacterium]|nr:hypothetical protein [Candidatus Neomarinimicrobiota bacterium]